MNPVARAAAENVDASSGGLLAYVATLGSLAVLAGLALIAAIESSAPVKIAPEPTGELHDWTGVAHPWPAFSASIPELGEPVYAVLRHDGGGRRDILTFGRADGVHAYAALEIYRPGAELERFADPLKEAMDGVANLGRIVRAGIAPAAGSKFGPIALLDLTLTHDEQLLRCLGFARNFAAPRLRISGVYCHPGAQPASRRVVHCALEDLSLVAAGEAPAVAEFFAGAERKRTFCGGKKRAAVPVGSDAWIDAVAAIELRGSSAEFED